MIPPRSPPFFTLYAPTTAAPRLKRLTTSCQISGAYAESDQRGRRTTMELTTMQSGSDRRAQNLERAEMARYPRKNVQKSSDIRSDEKQSHKTLKQSLTLIHIQTADGLVDRRTTPEWIINPPKRIVPLHPDLRKGPQPQPPLSQGSSEQPTP